MSQFKLHVTGKNADQVAEKITALFNENFGVEPNIQNVRPAFVAGQRGVDPVALTALVLSIPAAALAAMDVISRMKKKQQTEKTLAQLEQISRDYPQAFIRLEAPDGSIIEIKKENAGKILDAANSEKK